MTTNPFMRVVIAITVAIGCFFSAVAQASKMTPAEQVQVYASRATGTLIIIHGEGFLEEHLERLEYDLADLQGAAHAIMSTNPEIPPLVQKLVTQIRNGVEFGPLEENMPWDYPRELAQALRDVLIPARSVAGATPEGELPAKIEYLAVQYLSRSYLGSFEIAREQTDNYVGQDERLLIPQINEQIDRINPASSPDLARLKTRWKYLSSALSDMNSASSALISSSGRAFAPTAVDRHTRALTAQWIGLDHQIAAN